MAADIYMNIAIADDNPRDIAALQAVLDKYARSSGVGIRVTSFMSAEELLKGYRPFMYTVVFLDIYMEGMTGLEAAEAIRQEDSDTFLVFLTTSKEHMAEAFRTHAYDYIEKPFGEEEIFRVMDDMLRRRSVHEKSLTFTCNREGRMLIYPDIVMVTSSLHNVEIRDRYGNEYRPRISFSSVSDQLLSDRQFLLISRGIIVNMNYVEDFDQGVCFLTGGLSAPCNLRRQRELVDAWQNYIFTVIRGEAMKKIWEEHKK